MYDTFLFEPSRFHSEVCRSLIINFWSTLFLRLARNTQARNKKQARNTRSKKSAVATYIGNYYDILKLFFLPYHTNFFYSLPGQFGFQSFFRHSLSHFRRWTLPFRFRLFFWTRKVEQPRAPLNKKHVHEHFHRLTNIRIKAIWIGIMSSKFCLLSPFCCSLWIWNLDQNNKPPNLRTNPTLILMYCFGGTCFLLQEVPWVLPRSYRNQQSLPCWELRSLPKKYCIFGITFQQNASCYRTREKPHCEGNLCASHNASYAFSAFLALYNLHAFVFL